FISLARLFAAPLTVWLILTGEITVAFWTFFAAAVSDAVDGFIAKRFKRTTVLGAYLDPLADKALLVGVYVALGNAGHLELWLVILVVFRDLLIVGGALLFWLLTRSLTMQPLMISKVNTVAQIVLAAVMLGSLGLGVAIDRLIETLVYVVAATTLLSGGRYVMEWTRRAAGVEAP
ncbi:MAG: CDP-alcohol phosphatidyltransferase family protein, partial [Alphaproteobacteria bacterium]